MIDHSTVYFCVLFITLISTVYLSMHSLQTMKYLNQLFSYFIGNYNREQFTNKLMHKTCLIHQTHRAEIGMLKVVLI